MKRANIIFTCLACFLSFNVVALNAPVTTAGTVLNANTATGGVTIPVTVSNFIDIGNFTLTLDYTSSALTYEGYTPDPAFSGISVNGTTPGTIVITWTGGAGITLPDQTHLIDISFTYIAGIAYLTWDTTGVACRYKKYASGSFIVLNDSPKSSYYINGAVTSHPAPVTYAPVITNASPGTVYLSITVKNFTNIGALTLTFEYNSTVLTYLNDFTPNTAFSSSSFTVGAQSGPGGIPIIVIGYSGASVNLADSSTLVILKFNYANTPGNGNFSQLTWFDNGPSCEYTDGDGVILYDSPTPGFYKNGLVTNQVAPVTSLPVIVPATPGDSISVPVTVNNFTNITAISLAFEYNASVLTYGRFTKNPSLTGGFFLNNYAPAPNGKTLIVIGWSGSSTTLSNGSTLTTIRFHYSSGTSFLKFDTGQDSCQYADYHNNALYQVPVSSYYQNGLVASHVAPVTKTDSILGVVGQPATVHVKVAHFSNIGAFTLTMNYDPGALTYQSALLAPAWGGFTATFVELGQLFFAWSGSQESLSDSSILLNVTFTENGGVSPLTWFTNGSACQYSEGGVSPPLYDSPKANYYYNGWIMPFGADFSANNTTPFVDSTVIFTDLSVGGPASWSWSFSPGSVVYLNSTSSSSQNPQVKFTANGPYSVTLVITRGGLTSTKTKTGYIHAGTPGLWTGITSTDWNTGSNWHNWLVPGSSTNVNVPALAPKWPVFTGDLSLGTQCKNITMNGASQLSISGNLALVPGSSIICNGPDTLKVGGNWTNSGLFAYGIGSVVFTGSGTGAILGGVYPINWLSNYTRSTFAVGMTIISGTPTGLTGDNASFTMSLPFTFNYLGTSYTAVRINTNGWISLDQSGYDPTSNDNSLLFSTSVPNTTLAPWWDDLRADVSTTISYSSSGTIPNRIFTVEWKNILSYATLASVRLNFQVKLYETSNIIEFCYGTVGPGTLHNASESASIGIEDATGGSGHFIEATTGSMNTGITTLNSTSNWPVVNYRFTPPPATETFYNLIESKTGTSLSIQRDIIVNGTLTVK